MRALLLYSGGLDSTVLLHKMRPARALFFSYGQRHLKERTFAQDHCKKLGIRLVEISLPKLKGSLLTGEGNGDGNGSWVVPARNLTFLAVAANYAVARGFSHIIMGCNKDDHAMFGDCRAEFFEMVGRALERSDTPLRLELPLVNHTKKQIRDKAQHLGISATSIWSCYAGLSEPCGNCPACLLDKEEL